MPRMIVTCPPPRSRRVRGARHGVRVGAGGPVVPAPHADPDEAVRLVQADRRRRCRCAPRGTPARRTRRRRASSARSSAGRCPGPATPGRRRSCARWPRRRRGAPTHGDARVADQPGTVHVRADVVVAGVQLGTGTRARSTGRRRGTESAPARRSARGPLRRNGASRNVMARSPVCARRAPTASGRRRYSGIERPRRWRRPAARPRGPHQPGRGRVLPAGVRQAEHVGVDAPCRRAAASAGPLDARPACRRAGPAIACRAAS